MANEPTEEEVNAIIEEAAQNELARIAGVPEPENKPDAGVTAQKDEPETKQLGEENQEVQEPSLEDRFAALAEQNKQLRKHIDTTYGRHGQEVQYLKRRLEAVNTATAPNLNDVFSRINIEDPAFAELKEEFPELAGQFVTALNKALIREDATKPQSVPEPKAPAAERGTQQDTQITEQQETNNPALDRMALDTLQTKHPDFLELAHFSANQLAPGMVSVKWKNQKFGEWLDAMPSDVKEAVLIGGSVEQPTAAQILRISDIMTEFKQYESETNTTTDETKETKQESRPKPKVDLSRTLMPSSRQSNKVAMTDEEIIEAAKQAELKRVMNGG